MNSEFIQRGTRAGSKREVVLSNGGNAAAEGSIEHVFVVVVPFVGVLVAGDEYLRRKEWIRSKLLGHTHRIPVEESKEKSPRQPSIEVVQQHCVLATVAFKPDRAILHVWRHQLID